MNLIICITPLQVLIAKQIIKKTPEDFIGLYLPYGVNAKSEAKHRYYFGQLQQVCQQAAFLELKNQGIGDRTDPDPQRGRYGRRNCRRQKSL